jgi:predicted naringenin-chalcone synthase
MKTAMQELIERLDKTENQLENENNLVMSSALYAARSMALEALEKEKEQIMNAFSRGLGTELGLDWEDSEQYYERIYNQTYNN